MLNRIYFSDNLSILRSWPPESVDLIYIDPPFNTGRKQSRTQIKTERADGGDRVGFQGKRYQTIKLGSKGYVDLFDDYLAFLEPRLEQAYRILKPNGSMYFHIDFREVHYCKVLLDAIFGRESFLNEIIWAYDYGARSRANGLPNTIIFCGMPKTPKTIHSTWMPSIAFPTWRLVWLEKKKQKKARHQPTPGGIPSFPPMAKKKRAIQPRSRLESSEGSLRPAPTLVMW